MAILPRCPGLEVHILVHGQKLVEHRDEHEEGETPNRLVRYVEAVSGAEFHIQFKIKQDVSLPARPFQFRLRPYVDGHMIDSTCFLEEDWKLVDGQGSIKRVLDGALEQDKGITNKRCLKFADIRTDDQARPPSAALLEKVKEIGEIRLEFTKGTWERSKEVFTRKISVNEAMGKVSEKIFKGRAVSHQTAYGPPVATSDRSRYDRIYLDPEPFATFVFRYKSRDALRAERIIPRTPSPTPLEDRPVETLSAQELKELVRRQKDTLARVKSERALKRERSSQVQAQYASSDTEDGVEEIERPAKFRKVVETIDLSNE